MNVELAKIPYPNSTLSNSGKTHYTNTLCNSIQLNNTKWNLLATEHFLLRVPTGNHAVFSAAGPEFCSELLMKFCSQFGHVLRVDTVGVNLFFFFCGWYSFRSEGLLRCVCAFSINHGEMIIFLKPFIRRRIYLEQLFDFRCVRMSPSVFGFTLSAFSHE
ncbi:hypothetical protein CEXT_93641 [Caerostris extrusa]|uniref:Uncharacterized protein n=1 Tax=Caerostris extrusa TaxID=172846 RepID=A0AAV4P4D5_CAEEX|nr:hypothetical protein CEXT_93641 [Caerostris extrusa]